MNSILQLDTEIKAKIPTNLPPEMVEGRRSRLQCWDQPHLAGLGRPLTLPTGLASLSHRYQIQITTAKWLLSELWRLTPPSHPQTVKHKSSGTRKYIPLCRQQPVTNSLDPLKWSAEHVRMSDSLNFSHFKGSKYQEDNLSPLWSASDLVNHLHQDEGMRFTSICSKFWMFIS